MCNAYYVLYSPRALLPVYILYLMFSWFYVVVVGLFLTIQHSPRHKIGLGRPTFHPMLVAKLNVLNMVSYSKTGM